MPNQTIPPTNNLTATVILGGAIFKENLNVKQHTPGGALRNPHVAH